jgi:hypothetical protein
MAINPVITNNVEFNQPINQVNEQKKTVVGDNSVQEKGSIQEKLVVNSGESQKFALNNALDNKINLNETNSGVIEKGAKLSLASSAAEAESLVNRLTAQPPTANENDLINALKQNSRQNNPEGNSDFYQTVITRLVEKDPERAATLFNRAAKSPNSGDRSVLAAALSLAYYKGGKDMVDKLIKQGVAADSATAPSRANSIAGLIAQTGNNDLKRDYAISSLNLAVDYRNSKNNPAKQAISVALTNGGLTVAASNKDVLKDLFDLQAISLPAITSSIKSGSNVVAKVLSVATENGYSQAKDLFYHLSEKSDLNNLHPAIGKAMVDYFNKNGAGIPKDLVNGKLADSRAKGLSKFFGNIVLPNAEYTKSVLSSEGGFGKAINNTFDRAIKEPVSAGDAAGRLFGALFKGLKNLKEGKEPSQKILNTVGTQLGNLLTKGIKVPGKDFVVGKLSEMGAKKLLGESGVKSVQELSNKLYLAFKAKIQQGADELGQKYGRFDDANALFRYQDRVRLEMLDLGVLINDK